jgi:ferritin-like metal-binding protein YciE
LFRGTKFYTGENNLNHIVMQKTKSKTASKSRGTSRTQSSSRSSNASNAKSTSSSALQEFFVDQLKDIYWAEKHLTKTLPKMHKAATTEELKEALEDHLAVTEDQVTQLEKVFDMLGKKAQAKKCEAMEGLTKEGSSIIEETEKGSLTRDAGLIMAAQKVEHYEIATYGSLVQLAKTLQLSDVASILEGILNEEKEADKTLTEVAENNINIEASAEGAEEDEEETAKDEETE